MRATGVSRCTAATARRDDESTSKLSNSGGTLMIDKTHIGRTTPPMTFDVEKGRLKFFAKAIGETDAIYGDEEAAKQAGYASIPAPPTFGFCLEMESNSLWDNIAAMGVPVGKILHGSQTFTYHKPICAGDKITFETKVSNIYDKKGGALEFIEEDSVGKNQNGEVVVELHRVIVARN